MGGVIARYALADMEQNMQQTGVDHQTRLFISHDAPQQGANIPVSLQYMYRHLNNQYVKSPALLAGGEIIVPLFTDVQPVSTYLSILDLPATKQLLSNSSTSNYTINNFEHNAFYNELKAKGLPNCGGYPINCRNIAISNGAECGLGQGFNPGENLVNYNWNKGLTFGGDLLSMVYLPLGGVIGGRILDNDFYGVALTGLIPGKSKFDVEFNAKAMPYGTSNQIYKGKVSYTKKILWIGPNITVNITNVQKSQPAGILPLDTYGGGFYDTSIVAGSLTLPNLYVRDKFNFIPTTSSLDIGKRNIVLQDADYKSAYIGAMPPVAPNNSPFVNFSSDFEVNNPNSSNKSHISFNARNGEWFARELNANAITTNCSFLCSGTSSSQISGNETLCTSANYSAPTGATTYTWSITQGNSLVTLSGNGTNSIVLNKTSPNASGSVTLNLNFGSPTCGFRTITKVIWVGSKVFNDVVQNSSCSSVTIDFVGAGNSLSNISFSQFITNGTTVNPNVTYYANGTNSNGDPSFIILLPSNPQPSFLLYNITYTDNCGSTITQYAHYRPINCRSNYRLATANTTFQIFPNPSNSLINITLFDENLAPKPTAVIKGTLYDLNNIEKTSLNIIGNTAQIDVSHFKKGIYVLKISVDGDIESHQVIVE
ncbi:T9SS type A sorting domain-containing protein [Flavobacterium franklandianum]|uniref:T9SS type A sorting domain-containing protein n=1 Tax=Flavobacterium franklandianum TaxID=2594430 RepID=A0A553CMH3_9FLAO|nr:T9SS type A sorting domain-containing protein [Flavobacterium franklandianum]TRX21637.1 T9SS type A sorting domain-containing protein [Flavobacterium franklandianum]